MSSGCIKGRAICNRPRYILINRRLNVVVEKVFAYLVGFVQRGSFYSNGNVLILFLFEMNKNLKILEDYV